MNNAVPTVAVVMCTYNGENFIRQQLESILSQTHRLDEIIVQDDCSTDHTADIVRDYAIKHPCIKLVVNTSNKGFNANFRSALSLATCDYIALSDQDDIWYPEKIERQLIAIGDKDLCATAYHIGPSVDSAQYLSAASCIERSVFGGGVAGHTMLVAKEFLDMRNQWLDGITYDWSLLMNAYFGRGVIILDEALNWHRRHEKALGSVYHKTTGSKLEAAVGPYLHGWKQYRALQKKSNWHAMYAFIHEHTNENVYPLAHRLSQLMLNDSWSAMLKLCSLCLSHKSIIYPDRYKSKGIIGSLRAFAYPAIFAYNNYIFDWVK